MTSTEFKYVYGPVASRRLGRSLGVDLVPFKTCTYDCIYCQLGRTTHQTIQCGEYVPVDAVLAELKAKLALGPKPDYISLAGSGEPPHRRFDCGHQTLDAGSRGRAHQRLFAVDA